MTIIKKTNIALLVGCFALSTIALTGCRTAAIKKPSFQKLAFWKKDGSQSGNNVPPPPARHFDPAPIQKAKLAQEKYEGSEMMELGGRRFNEAFANSSIKADAEISTGARTTTQPIRKPYSTETPSKSLDSFNIATNNAQSKYSDAKAGLSNAQQDFQAAMQNTTNVSAESSNDFNATASKSSTAGGWKDFDLPTGLAKKGSASVNSSLKGINNAIYDANGKLASNANEAKSTFQNKLNDVNNSFQASSKSAVNSANAFSTSKSNSLQTVAQPQTGFGSQPGAQTPATSWNAQASSGFQAPAGFSAPSGFQAQTGASVTSTDSAQSASSTAGPASNNLESVQSQVADAKRQIELLKQQVAAAQQRADQAKVQATAQAQVAALAQAQAAASFPAPSQYQSSAQFQSQTPTQGFQANQYFSPPAQSPSSSAMTVQNTQPQNSMQVQAGRTQTEPMAIATPAQGPNVTTGGSATSFGTYNRALTSNQAQAAATFNSSGQTNGLQSGTANSLNRFASNNFGAASAPNSILRADGTVDMAQPTAPKPFAPTQPPASAPSTSYPTTPHGGYANQGDVSSNFAPAGISSTNALTAQVTQPASQVNFQASAESSSMHKASTPVANSSGAGRIQNHVSDVNIPAAVLTGSGSYAPGSVHSVSGN